MDRDEFVKQYNVISSRALALDKKAIREGLLSLEDEIAWERAHERDIFEYGLYFVCNGTDKEVINKILSNIIAQEKDENVKLLKTIQKEAVLAIQECRWTRLLLHILNSYTDIPLKDDETLRKELERDISLDGDKLIKGSKTVPVTTSWTHTDAITF